MKKRDDCHSHLVKRIVIRCWNRIHRNIAVTSSLEDFSLGTDLVLSCWEVHMYLAV